jgi:hypothetical protein
MGPQPTSSASAREDQDQSESPPFQNGRLGCSHCVSAIGFFHLLQFMAPLFDGLVGAYERRGRHVETEHLGGLEIDHRFVLGGRLQREVSRLLLALEDANRHSRRHVPVSGQGARAGTNFTRSSEPASWMA